MNKIRYILLAALLMAALPCLAQKEQKPFIDMLAAGEKPVCIATAVSDSSKIIQNPGNCPIEFLRRLGRALKKSWPEGKTNIKSATLLFNEFLGRPDFVKNFLEDNLSEKQLLSFNNLMNSHEKNFTEMMSEFNPAPEAITLKMVVNTSEILNNIKSLINGTNETDEKLPVLPSSEKEKIKENVLPVLEAFSDCYGLLSLSEKGIFGRVKVDCEKGNLQKFISVNNLTIQEYIDDEPLIILAQSHSIQEPALVMKRLESLPNMKVVNQIIASAGLDFEKDLVSNYATESILYVNLTPTGEKMIPDIRWVAKIPNAQNLIGIMPKLKNLCMQTGIFITPLDSPAKGVDLVKLNHFMTNGYSVYGSIVDKFCVLSSTEEGAIKAINRIQKPSKPEGFDDFKNCNFYFRLKTSELNVQLQQFLQSPILRNQGIPPITNLTFLKDMNDIMVKSVMTNKMIKVRLDIPFNNKNNN